jgi:hypothetical protein
MTEVCGPSAIDVKRCGESCRSSVSGVAFGRDNYNKSKECEVNNTQRARRWFGIVLTASTLVQSHALCAQEAADAETSGLHQSIVPDTNSTKESANGSADERAANPEASELLRAGTELRLRLLEAVASNTHRRGDRFKLQVADALRIGDVEVIPQGALGEGEVIHAAKAGMAGRAGELILTARFVQVNDTQIKLRAFSAGTGQDRYNLAAGLGVTLGLPALFVSGKNLVVPQGTDVFARVAVDVPLSSLSTHSPSYNNMETKDEP